jgi:hypothetical protein
MRIQDELADSNISRAVQNHHRRFLLVLRWQTSIMEAIRQNDELVPSPDKKPLEERWAHRSELRRLR